MTPQQIVDHLNQHKRRGARFGQAEPTKSAALNPWLFVAAGALLIVATKLRGR